ncbi:hypothetical protein QE152_g38993 [Popillia japonica]|uniref:Uncharacterized protein n=1 Tax=Popillia japonica TaxID=7064 RepID=A0AAW1HV72_POPJA
MPHYEEFSAMDSPISEYPIDKIRGTPRCHVSPNAVSFLEDQWRTPPAATSASKTAEDPSPVLLHLESPRSPDLSQFSPKTEEFIQWQFLECFGSSPVKERLSPLPLTPLGTTEAISPAPGAQEHSFPVPHPPTPRAKESARRSSDPGMVSYPYRTVIRYPFRQR